MGAYRGAYREYNCGADPSSHRIVLVLYQTAIKLSSASTKAEPATCDAFESQSRANVTNSESGPLDASVSSAFQTEHPTLLEPIVPTPTHVPEVLPATAESDDRDSD